MNTAKQQAGLEISLRIGQRVRHHDFHGKRVTGVVRGLSVDSEDVLRADIALDEPIVIPPMHEGDRELPIYRQHVPAHELAPFDEREELIERLQDVLQAAKHVAFSNGFDAALPEKMEALRAAIAKAGGAAC